MVVQNLERPQILPLLPQVDNLKMKSLCQNLFGSTIRSKLFEERAITIYMLCYIIVFMKNILLIVLISFVIGFLCYNHIYFWGVKIIVYLLSTSLFISYLKIYLIRISCVSLMVKGIHCPRHDLSLSPVSRIIIRILLLL